MRLEILLLEVGNFSEIVTFTFKLGLVNGGGGMGGRGDCCDCDCR